MENMDEGDDFWRMLILGTGCLGAIVWLVGGLLTPVAGRWRDPEGADIILQQLGPRVWGEGKLSGGFQRFSGWVMFGRVRLKRSDFGMAHLQSLGFSPEQVRQIEGQITGTLELKLSNRDLEGVFYGRKFSFEDKRVRSTPQAQATPRTWQRMA